MLQKWLEWLIFQWRPANKGGEASETTSWPKIGKPSAVDLRLRRQPIEGRTSSCSVSWRQWPSVDSKFIRWTFIITTFHYYFQLWTSHFAFRRPCSIHRVPAFPNKVLNFIKVLFKLYERKRLSQIKHGCHDICRFSLDSVRSKLCWCDVFSSAELSV